MSGNRGKVFAEIIAIDAWHKPFGSSRAKVSLHADVVFSTARLGGEKESPVRFRLSLKRAEVVVIIPDTEPIKINRASVAREKMRLKGNRVQIVARSKKGAVKGRAAASIGKKSVGAEMAASAQLDAESLLNDRIEFKEDVSSIIVKQSKTRDGHYRWELAALASRVLDGRAWDPVKEPRLNLRDLRSDRSHGIAPVVRIVVRCLKEDLIIDDLQIKDETIWTKLQSSAGLRNKMAAAECYIRDRLTREGLEFGDLSDPFGQLTLAEVLAEGEE